MAIFFPPPPPFIGGAQPFAQHNGNVPSEAVRVDNPPPSHMGRSVAFIVAAALAWQPAPPDAFAGGRQPLAARTLPPSLLAVPVNNPPFGGSPSQEPQFQTVLTVWQPPPADANFGAGQALTPRKLPPSLLNVQVDQPPFGGSATQDPQFYVKWLAWQAPPPNAYFGAGQALQPKTLTPVLLNVRVDAPPFGGSAAQEPAMFVAIASWQPPDPNPNFGAGQALQAKKLSPSLVAVRVDNPPGIAANMPWLLWPADNVPQQRYAQIIIPAASFVGAAGAAQFATILSAWQPAEFRQVTPRNLPPAITDVRVDNPPGISAASMVAFGAWTTVTQATIGPVLSAAFTQIAGTPFNPLSPGILAAWQPAPTSAVLARLLPPSLTDVRVDNPPGLVAQPAWQADAQPQPTRLAGGIAPLFIAAGQTPYALLPLSVLTAWIATDPQPTLPRKLAPSITAVRVDNPPGIVPQAPPFSWQPVAPQPTTPQGVAALLFVASPQVRTPYAPLPASILDAWNRVDPTPTFRNTMSLPIASIGTAETLYFFRRRLRR